jgi:ATP-dependent exoDNAse (exonuclease V) alpha subunit
MKLAFVMSINKSQGQTFQKVGIYLPSPVFAHGQLYVAFSRTSKFENVRVKIENYSESKQLIKGDSYFTKNIVYNELLE